MEETVVISKKEYEELKSLAEKARSKTENSTVTRAVLDKKDIPVWITLALQNYTIDLDNAEYCLYKAGSVIRTSENGMPFLGVLVEGVIRVSYRGAVLHYINGTNNRNAYTGKSNGSDIVLFGTNRYLSSEEEQMDYQSAVELEAMTDLKVIRIMDRDVFKLEALIKKDAQMQILKNNCLFYLDKACKVGKGASSYPFTLIEILAAIEKQHGNGIFKPNVKKTADLSSYLTAPVLYSRGLEKAVDEGLLIPLPKDDRQKAYQINVTAEKILEMLGISSKEWSRVRFGLAPIYLEE